MFEFTAPNALALLLCALIPLFRPGQASLPYSACALLPVDRLSSIVDWVLRLMIALCIASLVFGIAGFHRSAYTEDKVGQGAQTVILLDSSGSMDRPFASLS